MVILQLLDSKLLLCMCQLLKLLSLFVKYGAWNLVMLSMYLLWLGSVQITFLFKIETNESGRKRRMINIKKAFIL